MVESNNEDGGYITVNSGTYTTTKTLPAGTKISVYVERTLIADGYVGEDHTAGYVYNGLMLIIL